MAWAYLVGGDGDGQFFEHDDQAIVAHPTWGAMLRGPGRSVYRAAGRQVSGAHGRCEIYESHGRWVPYEEQDRQREGGQRAGEMSGQPTCPACAATGWADGDPAEYL